MSQIASKIKRITHLVAPLVRTNPQLKPVNDISPNRTGNTGNWMSTGEDPQFYFKPPAVRLPSGWYMLAVKISGSYSRDEVRIYIDCGNGFREADSVGLPYQSRLLTKRLIRIPAHSKRLRFDPQSGPGSISIQEFSLTAVTGTFAENKMLTKLMNCARGQNYQSVEATQADLIKQSERTGQPYETVLQRQYSAIFSDTAVQENYQDWIARIETASQPDPLALQSLAAVTTAPIISVLMPTYNTDCCLLEAAIESVIKQSYGRWQLCISDGGSSEPALRELLQRYASWDDRIQISFQSAQTPIAENTNVALELAEGKFCVFLDHDDLLSEHALYEVAVAVTKNPKLKLIYSDEDKIDNEGFRSQPHFKPDWNPDLLLSQNYMCHLVAVSTEEILAVGGFRSGYEGAQDHDLLLRVTCNLDHSEIHHISKILYHWRATEGSTAASAAAKQYSTDSGIAAVEDYVTGLDQTAFVESGKYPNTYRVRWSMPAQAPLASIIVPTRDRFDILSQCIDSVLKKTDYDNYEIIIVDNESSEVDTLDYLSHIQKLDKVRVLKYSGNFNFSAINNMAVRHAHGSVITLMNNDIEVIGSGWLHEMVSHAIRPGIGCVGAKLLYKNHQVQHGGVILGIGGVAGHAHKYFHEESPGYFSRLHLTQNLSAVTAACLTVSKQTYLSVGGLNENDLKVAFNDVDFCLKVDALGLRNVWTPYALLYHHESISRGHDNTPEKKSRFINEAAYMRDRWGDQLLQDPAYNRNLTLAHEDFSMAA